MPFRAQEYANLEARHLQAKSRWMMIDSLAKDGKRAGRRQQVLDRKAYAGRVGVFGMSIALAVHYVRIMGLISEVDDDRLLAVPKDTTGRTTKISLRDRIPTQDAATWLLLLRSP